jgi:hypothetical protein
MVDGPKDMRFAMTAKTLASMPEEKKMNEITAKNVEKVTRYRKNGIEDLREMIEKMRDISDEYDGKIPPPRRVYPEDNHRRKYHYPDP